MIVFKIVYSFANNRDHYENIGVCFDLSGQNDFAVDATLGITN